MADYTTSAPTQPFPPAEYIARIRRLQKSLRPRGVDAMLVMTPVNRLYLTGLESSNGLLLLRPGQDAAFYTDFRYLEMARRAVGFLPVRRLEQNTRLRAQYTALAGAGHWRRVGYEGTVTAAALSQMKKHMPAVEEWIDCSADIGTLRSVKSRREQAVIRRAVAANDAVFAAALKDIRAGMTEWEISRLIRAWADRLSQGEAFPCIACVGSNASECHHHPSMRTLTAGRELLLDLGARVDGYLSDMTRTVFFGAPSATLATLYDIVLRANRAAIAAIRPGRACREIDAVARKVIADAGYGKYFGHGLGHSLGLEIHEEPRFSPDHDTALKAGMVLTVEPGIYLPGVGGVRIEDLILVRPNGCEVLTRSPKDFRSAVLPRRGRSLPA